jgi:Domain of unknown function (DUF4399)
MCAYLTITSPSSLHFVHMRTESIKKLFLAIFTLAYLLQPAMGQSNKEHRWLAAAPWHDPKATFTNLKHNDQVISPFVVQFGMSNWGIAPAKHNHPRTGHHHLLIDTALPIPITTPIPVSKNYVHFGAGQMQTVLDLPVGEHTLRLLLADHEHVPHMVFSQEIKVIVTSRSEEKAQLLKTKAPELAFPNIKDGDVVSSYFKLQFHAAGFNISSQVTKLANTGHFKLIIRSTKGGTESIPFPSGVTETWLKLPEGEYKLSLNLVDNQTGEDSAEMNKFVSITVRK